MGRTPAGETRERVFRFVRRRILSGNPPSVREVQQEMKFRAVQTAQQHLQALLGEGRLVQESGRSRGYGLPRELGHVPRLVPLLGRVQAGTLTAAIEDPEGYLAVETRAESEDLFALRVRGDSMIGASILPGDLVIVRRQPTADSGDLVVALVEDEATVKRLRLRRGRPELHAENPDYAPIVPRPGDLQLLGRVVEVRRYLDGSIDRNKS